MSKPFVVAAAQMNSQNDIAANLAAVRERVRDAREAGAELVVLPENFAFMGGTEEERRTAAEPVPLGSGPFGPIVTALSSLAREAGITLVGGGMPEASGNPDRPYNACVVVAPDGSVVARYRKMHLFDVDVGDGQTYRESGSVTPGDAPTTIKSGPFTLGLSVCYDVRFPELYRRLSEMGADVLLVPAAFTLMTGKDHWHVLLRARAIENQAFVVAPAQWGKHPRGRTTYGKSIIVDPWGEVIAQASEGEGLAIARLDPSLLHRIRESLPSLRHRRL